jgi:RNA polymerase sigma factor (TIGR02999 family)
MATHSSYEITEMLRAWSQGDNSVLNKLFPLVYKELRTLANRMRKWEHGQVFQTTALVHEAYLRLLQAKQVNLQDRNHFFRLAAKIMRQILIDFARKNPHILVAFDKEFVQLTPEKRGVYLTRLKDALDELETIDPRKSKIIDHRFFLGQSVEETSETLGIPPRTLMREWKKARAWLYRELTGNEWVEEKQRKGEQEADQSRETNNEP